MGKKKLKSDAIPTLNLEGQEIEDEEFLEPNLPKKARYEDGKCQNCEKNVKACNYYRKKYNELLKKFKKCRHNMRPYKRCVLKPNKENSKKMLQNSIESLEISTESKTFCKLLTSTRPKKYSDDVRYLAQNIFYICISVYVLFFEKQT